ncbi:DUF3858 domain-containing protein [Flavobacterium sp. WC2421]|uniref:DUF3858 domain-containing protein n=1 Tax=Flavobacterium sp. WC2421 TaxID=3234138 RepID=UPI0034660AFE
MKYCKVGIVLVVFLLFSKSSAQNLEYGKVTNQELQVKVHPLDSTAAAAIIFKKARTYFVYERGNGFYLYHDFNIRFKVYKKEGLKWADFSVIYLNKREGFEEEIVKFSNCVTYNLENGELKETPLRTEGNLKTNINKYWNQTLITMPNVKVGSIFQINYTVKSRNNVRFPVFNFQYEIPVNYAEYQTDIPEVFIYKTLLTGYNKVEATSKIVKETESFSHKYNQQSDFPYKYQLASYKAENIPALKEEAYIDNIKNYRSSIQHELETTRFPFDGVVDYSMTWDGVAKNIFDYNSFGRELNKDNYLDAYVKALNSNVTTEIDKLETIFKFVQAKMNFDGDYSILTDKGVKKAYKDGTGNTAEINLILIAMLKSAGIKTDPVLISTIQHGVPVYPNRTVFNSVIAAAEIDGKQILMDASNKYSSVGILPLEDLNWTGRLIKEEGDSQEINLVPDKNSNENVNIVVALDAQGKMVGQTRIRKTDYVAQRFRESTALLTDDKYLEKLESDLGGILIDDYKQVNDDTNSSTVIESFKFTSNKHCEIIAGKIYINPLLFFNTTQNPFVLEKRQMPVYFGYPKTDKYNINIEIPKGYKVVSVPQPIKISTANSVGSYSINIAYDNDKIQIVIVKEINLAVVPPDLYDALKDFFQKMMEKQNEKIVLTKI